MLSYAPNVGNNYVHRTTKLRQSLYRSSTIHTHIHRSIIDRV
jgi:hypothetical protein